MPGRPMAWPIRTRTGSMPTCWHFSRMARTKIICTLGPASAGRTVLEKMMRAGMDVGRLNFSHGSPQEALKKIRIIRLMNGKQRRRIKLLGDLQGHRIRVGDLPAPVLLEKNHS